MPPDQIEPYVRAALALHGYQFTEAQIAGILLQFARFAAIADTFIDMPLPLELDAAPVFRP